MPRTRSWHPEMITADRTNEIKIAVMVFFFIKTPLSFSNGSEAFPVKKQPCELILM
jgi:hypothetical protein